MLTINDLKPGIVFLLDGMPFEVIEADHLHQGRGGAVVETKVRNLKTGAVLSRNFKPADTFEEAEVEKEKVEFLYGHRGEFWFVKPNDPKSRFMLQDDILPENIKRFLKPKIVMEAVKVNGEVISVRLPIKIELRVVEAPPGIRGDTAQGGSKTVKLETGAEIQVPLFIGEGDIVRVNTESGLYAERVEKAK